MHCTMGCQPPEGGAGETYYRIVMEELTIYAHTTDAHTRAHYPDEMTDTLAGRARGVEFGCSHSSWCPSGELGRFEVAAGKTITYAEFMEAAENGWPYVQDEGITQDGPVTAVGYEDENGEPVETWNSIQGDRHERAH